MLCCAAVGRVEPEEEKYLCCNFSLSFLVSSFLILLSCKK